MGSLAGSCVIMTPLVVGGIALAHALVKPLNALLLGETYAASIGTSVARIRAAGLRVCRPSRRPGHRVLRRRSRSSVWLLRTSLAVSFRPRTTGCLIPAAALAGSLLGMSADLVTHLPWNRHFLHLDAVIGMVGAPIALWVILRRRHMRALEI